MPLIYWFSRRMTLWGSISFNLAVFINIIIAFFYPYVEGASTGQDGGLAGRDLGAHGPPPPDWGEPGGQLSSEGTRCRLERSTSMHCPLGCTPRCGETQVWSSGTDRVLDLWGQLTHVHTHEPETTFDGGSWRVSPTLGLVMRV